MKETKQIINNFNKDCNVYNAPVNIANFFTGGQFQKQAETQTSSSETERETTEEQMQPVAALHFKKTITPTVPTYDEMEGVRKSIIELMNVTENGQEIFFRKAHWTAVYRVLVDNNIIGKGYKAFADFIESLQLPEMRIPFSYHSLRKTVSDSFVYNQPMDLWQKKYMTTSSSFTSFDNMYEIACTFLDILKQNKVI